MATKFTTLITRCGLPKWLPLYPGDNLKKRTPINKAWNERRALSIHHGETNRQSSWGEPTESCCNMIGEIEFPKPIPGDVTYVIGIDQHLHEIRGHQ